MPSGKVKAGEQRQRKARVFVGSSKESLSYAKAIHQNLDASAEVTTWNQAFGLSKFTLNQLIERLERSDFGIFVCSADDVALIRRKKYSVARDNVIFELGMFIGRLGLERSFIVVPRGCEDLHLPSDLAGLNYGSFDPDREDNNMKAALAPVCDEVAVTMQELGRIDQELSDRQLVRQLLEEKGLLKPTPFDSLPPIANLQTQAIQPLREKRTDPRRARKAGKRKKSK